MMGAEFWSGVVCGAGGLLVLSALVVAVLVWRAPRIEGDEREVGYL